MLAPAGDRVTRRKRTTLAPLPIPYMGWNTRDQLAEIQPTFAPIIDNMVPQDGALVMRNGFTAHKSGVTGGVETLMTYDNGTTRKLWACGNSAIYDISSAGALGSAAVSSLTNNRWDWLNFDTTGGVFLLAANGADGVRSYNGSAWATETITGATAANLQGLIAHKSRVWAIEKSTLNAWYMDNVEAKSGGMTRFPLGPLCAKGGSLAALATWTRDGGSGLDDLFVAITTQGEVLIYQGTNPGSTSWYLVGRYEIPQPVGGTRCTVNVGGSLWVMTRTGVVAMDDVLSGVPERPRVTQVIEPTFRDIAASQASAFGWQAVRYVPENWLICNVPQGGGTFYQYVLNISQNSWCRFTGMNAQCWAEYNGEIYFGTAAGAVLKADDGESDDGDPISVDLVFSHNKFGTGEIKRFTGAFLHYLGRGNVNPSVAMLTNYDLTGTLLTADLSFATDGALWDQAEWDQAEWEGIATAKTRRLGLRAMGQVGALRVKFRAQDTALSLTGAEVAFETGQTI